VDVLCTFCSHNFTSILIHPTLTPSSATPPSSPSASIEPVLARGILRKFSEVGLFGIPDPSKRPRGVEVLSELAKLENEWKTALQESVAATTLDFAEAELAGVPASALESMKPAAASPGSRVVTLSYPHVNAVLGFCEVRATREAVYKAFRARGGEANEARILQLARLRREFAEIRGYGSFADHVQAGNRMAGSAEKVVKFLADLEVATREPAKGERAELETFARGDLGLDELKPWDSGFAVNRFKKARSGLDMAEVNKYFPADHVIKEVLKLYQELLSMKFEVVDTDDKWHDDVAVYRAQDADTGKYLGRMYLDLWPREGCYGHACVCNLIDTRHDAADTVDIDACAMITNFSKQMTHSDAVTFLHEFGHVTHDLAMRHGGKSAFAKCPRDFVEAPSQMLENWMWDTDMLVSRFTKHVETGAPMPREMAEQLRASKHTLGFLGMRRQLQYATFDLFLHDAQIPTTVAEVAAKEQALARDLCSWEIDGSFSSMARNFGHTAAQYSAAYYGYAWAEVLSCDMFHTVFSGPGALTDPVKGKHYRDCILVPGGTLDANTLVRNFLGREPSIEAFNIEHGIAKRE
jgi:thimet oligopeptidase